MSRKRDIFYLILFFENVYISEGVDCIVDTNVGTISGQTATDGDYTMFMGIPYAVVDENNPFGASTPYPAFNETFEAYDDSAMCPQVFPFNGTTLGTLDCLHLNIYVPSNATSDNLLPVMVFIHGGLFNFLYGGRYLFGPKYLVAHDVILVTLNYRLGPYGFMCLGISEVPGNQGLKDQLLALRWVKNNIEAFGGDTDQITLFGESAGGHSVDLHLTSSKEMLYNKVILQSGSAVAATVLYDADKAAPLKIAEHLGYETTNTTEALAYLAQSDTSSVINAATQLSLVFKPCVESEFDGVESFITSHWVDAEVPKVQDIPILLGFNENELAVIHTKASNYSVNSALVAKNLNLTFDFDNETFQEKKTIIEHFYFGDEESDGNLTLEAIYFDSDYTYIHPIRRRIRKYLESCPENIFHYMFSYIGGMNILSNFASHGDELAYLFHNERSDAKHISADDIIIERMTTMWTNFAKYSDPTPEPTDVLPVKWLPLTDESYYYLKIDTELSLGSQPLHQRLAFWDMFYEDNKRMQKFLDNSSDC